MAFLPLASSEYNLLLQWWEASTLMGYKDGDDVLSWQSQTTGGATLTGSAGVTPKYKENILNGQPALLFDGVNDQLASGLNWNALTTGWSGNLWIACLWKPLATPGVGGTARVYGSSDGTAPGMRLLNPAGTVQEEYRTYNGGTYDTATASPADALWHISMLYHSTLIQCYINDPAVYVDSQSCGGVTLPALPLIVGSNGAGGAYANMYVASLLIGCTGPMTATAWLAFKLRLFAYLCAKYFSPNAVDSDHRSPLMRGDTCEQVRSVLTRRLLDRERRESLVKWTGHRALVDVQLGEAVLLAHPQGPDPFGVAVPPGVGWPDSAPRPHRVLKIDDNADGTYSLLMEPLS